MEKIEIEIDGKNIVISSLGLDCLGDIMILGRKFSRFSKDSTPEEIMSAFDKETIDAISNLIRKTLKKSLPDLLDDEIDQFGLKNMMVLLPKIIEVNTPTLKNKADMKDEVIKRLNVNTKQGVPKKE